MTRTGHAAAAVERLATVSVLRDMVNSGRVPDEHVVLAFQSAELTLAEAQVHAQLALVEQQRIANLIALAAASHPVLSQQVAQDAARTLASFVPHSMGGYSQVRYDVAAALGIVEAEGAEQ